LTPGWEEGAVQGGEGSDVSMEPLRREDQSEQEITGRRSVVMNGEGKGQEKNRRGAGGGRT